MGGRQISRHFICPSQISTPFPPKASAQSEKRLFRCALRRQEVEGEGGGGGHLGWCFAVHLLLPHPMILTVRHTQWHSLQNTQWYSQHQKRRTLNIEWKRFKDTSVLGVSFPDYKFPGRTCLRRTWDGPIISILITSVVLMTFLHFQMSDSSSGWERRIRDKPITVGDSLITCRDCRTSPTLTSRYLTKKHITNTDITHRY